MTVDIRPLVKVEDATSRSIVEVLVRLLMGVWSGAEYTDRDDVQARALRSAELVQAAQRQARRGMDAYNRQVFERLDMEMPAADKGAPTEGLAEDHRAAQDGAALQDVDDVLVLPAAAADDDDDAARVSEDASDTAPGRSGAGESAGQKARKLGKISYEEMLELASLDATIRHADNARRHPEQTARVQELIAQRQALSRAANAAYVVAEQVDSDQYMEFAQELFSHQGTGGLSNQQIADIANKHGANVTAGQLGENTYRPMVDVATRESVTNGVAGTPTMFVDGKRYEEGAFEDMLKKAVDAKK